MGISHHTDQKLSVQLGDEIILQTYDHILEAEDLARQFKF